MTIAYLHILSLILLASNIRDTMSINEGICCITVSTTAAPCVTAIDKGLDGWNYISLSA